MSVSGIAGWKLPSKALVLIGSVLIFLGLSLPWIEYEGAPLGRITDTGMDLDTGRLIFGVSVVIAALALVPIRKLAPFFGGTLMILAVAVSMLSLWSIIDLEAEPWWNLDVSVDVINAVSVWTGPGWLVVLAGAVSAAIGGRGLLGRRLTHPKPSSSQSQSLP